MYFFREICTHAVYIRMILEKISRIFETLNHFFWIFQNKTGFMEPEHQKALLISSFTIYQEKESMNYGCRFPPFTLKAKNARTGRHDMTEHESWAVRKWWQTWIAPWDTMSPQSTSEFLTRLLSAPAALPLVLSSSGARSSLVSWGIDRLSSSYSLSLW